VNASAPPSLRPEDFPEVDPLLLETLSRAFRQQYEVLAAIPVVELVEGVTFTSAASGVSTVDVRNPLDQKPRHVDINIHRADSEPLAAVWSFEWAMAGESIRLSILGLPASEKMRLSLEAR
jgi:hypothetical protein